MSDPVGAALLRAEAERLDDGSKARTWGLLDRDGNLTDDGTAGRFVALAPDQLRFAAAILDRLTEGERAAAGTESAPPPVAKPPCPKCADPDTVLAYCDGCLLRPLSSSGSYEDEL